MMGVIGSEMNELKHIIITLLKFNTHLNLLSHLNLILPGFSGLKVTKEMNN